MKNSCTWRATTSWRGGELSHSIDYLTSPSAAVLEFEHKGWQSKQCELFADIFSEAIRNGLPAIQTQHPGLYYQQAAQHAIARRELAEELCASESAPKVDYRVRQ